MRFSHFTAGALVVVAGISPAFAQNLPADLVQARADRRAAMIQGNPANFDKLTTADYIGVDATGRVETKAERASRIQAPATPPGPLAPPQRLNEHTLMYNNDTVVFFWQQTNPQGTQFFSETWVKDNGQWKCAESHQSFGVPAPARGGNPGGREGGGGRGGN
jgi:hypothetical protein